MIQTRLPQGSLGKQVTELHATLQAQGFSVPSSEARRSFFGPGTQKAVAEFQKASGLNGTGRLDAQTVNLLSNPQQQVSPPPKINPGPMINSPPALAMA